jgi:hypothetical protein
MNEGSSLSLFCVDFAAGPATAETCRGNMRNDGKQGSESQTSKYTDASGTVFKTIPGAFVSKEPASLFNADLHLPRVIANWLDDHSA